MKRLAIAASLTAALVLSSVALAAAALPGKYQTKIASPAQLKGTWVLTFTTGSTYTVADGGQVVIRGRYSTTGSSVSFGHETGPAACPTAAKYSWKRAGKTLKLTRITDSCPGRTSVLSHTFTKES